MFQHLEICFSYSYPIKYTLSNPNYLTIKLRILKYYYTKINQSLTVINAYISIFYLNNLLLNLYFNL